MDEERMRPGHWLGLMLCVPFSDLTLTVGYQEGPPAREKTASLLAARRNARIASAVLAIAIPSVCPSVRHTPVLCQNDGT